MSKCLYIQVKVSDRIRLRLFHHVWTSRYLKVDSFQGFECIQCSKVVTGGKPRGYFI